MLSLRTPAKFIAADKIMARVSVSTDEWILQTSPHKFVLVPSPVIEYTIHRQLEKSFIWAVETLPWLMS